MGVNEELQEAESMMLLVPGWSGLTDDQKRLFVRVRKAHLSMMGTERRLDYQWTHVKKIMWVPSENCLHVHYKNDWYHYDTRGHWY